MVKGFTVAVTWFAPEPPEPMAKFKGPQATVAEVVATPPTVQDTVAEFVVGTTETKAAGQGVGVAFSAMLSRNTS